MAVFVAIFATQGVLRLIEAFVDMPLWASCAAAGLSGAAFTVLLLRWKERS